MHAAANNLRGGVSPRGTLLRGQSIIEYVLIVAIIGLVVVFAGPQVSQAIHNQFGSVTNTLASGTHGGGFTGAGGTSSGGAGSNTPNQEQIKYLESMKSVTEKDAKDWTLADQQLAAEDIAKRGTASVAFPKAREAMDAGTEFSVKLTNGQALTYRIVGINHDDLADGSGKAGLTFLTTSTNISSRMNAENFNTGGWEKSELRQKMNSGEIWNLMPSDFQSKVKSVKKLTNNVGGGEENKNATVTATSDRLFLLSYSEIVPTSCWASDYPAPDALDPDAPDPEPAPDYPWTPSDYPWTSSEGAQYEAFRGKVTNNFSGNSAIAIGNRWWERSVSVSPNDYDSFLSVGADGDPTGKIDFATNLYCVCPAWCF